MSQFTVIPGSKRVPLPGAHANSSANPHTTIEVLVKLRGKAELPELTGRPAVMTREELASKYGASEEDMKKVIQVMEGLGLTTVSSDTSTRSVTFSGSIAEMEAAFQVKLFDYDHPDGNYRGYVGYKHIPTELQGIVENVVGLDDRRVARRRRQPVQDAHRVKKVAAVPSSWYKPAELATHYNFPPGDGSGQVVGLLEFGGGYFPADLSTFCRLVGIATVPTVIPVSADGISTSAKDGAEGEVMLDVEVVAGVCPKATIVVYFAEWGEKGWLTILDTVMRDSENDPSVISISWGAPEDTDIWTAATMDQVNKSLQAAALLGITICVASGDDGSSDADGDGRAHVDFPSCSPYVLSVGGTTVPKKGGTTPDLIWFEGNGLRSSGHGSTGGGVSNTFLRPSWQAEVKIPSVNPGSIVGRCIPDIAANADWDASPYLLVVDNGSQPNGGTSAATPLLASLIALINATRGAGKRVGYLTPLLYQPVPGAPSGPTVGATACTDIVGGNNKTAHGGGYSAVAGYDAATGWGTPNGVKLLEALSSL